MEFENEKNYEEKPATEQNTGSRDGYTSAGNGFQHDYRGRSPRPRIHTGQRPAYNAGDRPSFNRNNDEGGFRPEGFGAGLQGSMSRQQGSYRPRTNYNNSGYQPRQSQGEYGQSRGSYGYNSRPNQGGYQPRQHQGGYRPGYNRNGEEGGYQSRPSQGGYRPYNSNGGYRPGQQQSRPGNRPYGKAPYGGGQKPYNKRQRTADYDPNAKYSLKKRIEYKEVNYDPKEPVRLKKYLANAGVCSRREADEFIQAGVITVNGQVVTELGTKILRTDEVKFHDQRRPAAA